MTNFKKIAASPEALGAFLASLPIATGPWDECFHRTFCDSCSVENCDAENCPHKKERNDPTWWLTQETEITEQIITAMFRGVTQEQTACNTVWKSSQVKPEPEMIAALPSEERHEDGACNEFNVYLNGKGPDEKVLRNIKRVIMPTVSTDENGNVGPMDMKLVFGKCEDVEEIVALLGKKCKLEVRAAVESWEYGGQVEFHGYSYIFEAVPMQIDTDTVKKLAGLGLTIGFLVYRYTATVGDTQLWDFEWKEQGKRKRK